MPKKANGSKRTNAKKKNISSQNQPPIGIRTDPHQRLLCRFYEPLILLLILGKTRDDHTPPGFPRSSNFLGWPLKDLRRLFLRELAYVCDYEKGGGTVTAIGLQTTPQQKIFWIAANSCPDEKIIPFLRDFLTTLKTIGSDPASEEEDVELIAKRCIQFSTHRIKAYTKIVRKQIVKCLGLLSQKMSGNRKCKRKLFIFVLPLLCRLSKLKERELTDQMLALWLGQFQQETMSQVELCRMAYDCRKDKEMKLLQELSQAPTYKSSPDAMHAQYQHLRHGIGRLGRHFRSARILVTSIPKLPSLLDDYDVFGIPTPERAQPPLVDAKTNLDSMIGRMLPYNSPNLGKFKHTLSKLDQNMDLTKHFIEKYEDPNFQPLVHAEVQVLDFFWKQNLEFEDDDPHIAVSKPACYCCSLYFRHHPQNPVSPASHQNVHRNWRLPDFEPEDRTQRDILNKMNVDIRKQVLGQLARNGERHPWHPDSTTGITDSDQTPMNRKPLEEAFDALTWGANSDEDLSSSLSDSYDYDLEEEILGGDDGNEHNLEEEDLGEDDGNAYGPSNSSSDWNFIERLGVPVHDPDIYSDVEGGALLP